MYSFSEWLVERDIGPIEKESNQKDQKTPDGKWRGPDPAVQKELKHRAFLNRVVSLRTSKKKAK